MGSKVLDAMERLIAAKNEALLSLDGARRQQEADRTFAQELWDALDPYQRAGLLVNGLRLPRWLELANDGLLDLPQLRGKKIFQDAGH